MIDEWCLIDVRTAFNYWLSTSYFYLFWQIHVNSLNTTKNCTYKSWMTLQLSFYSLFTVFRQHLNLNFIELQQKSAINKPLIIDSNLRHLHVSFTCIIYCIQIYKSNALIKIFENFLRYLRSWDGFLQMLLCRFRVKLTVIFRGNNAQMLKCEFYTYWNI